MKNQYFQVNKNQAVRNPDRRYILQLLISCVLICFFSKSVSYTYLNMSSTLMKALDTQIL